MKIFIMIGSFLIYTLSYGQSLTEILAAQENPSVNVGDSFQKGLQTGQQYRMQQQLIEQQRIQNEMMRIQLERQKAESEALSAEEDQQDSKTYCENQCEYMYKNKKLKKGVTVASCIKRTCN